MKIVLGTVQFGLDYGINNSRGKPSKESVFAILKAAHRLGFDELDTADAYGNSTEILSAFRKECPSYDFKIMSKFILNGEYNFRDAFEKSCHNLGVSSLEGFYFHRFQEFKSFKHFDILRSLKQEGRLKKIAVSLYTNEELEMVVNHPEVDLIQLPFNLFDCSAEKISLLKKAKRSGKQIYVRSVFLQGLFFKDLKTLPEKLQPLQAALLELHSIVQSRKIKMEDLCLKFATDQSFIDKVVIGVDSLEQLEKNVASLNADIPGTVFEEVLKIKISNPQFLNPANWNS
jgi:aryl-alcohol dehydrogenase-like predicted oxidoreductase